jgi:septum formation protein
MDLIILASGSARRQNYFKMLNLPFEVIETDTNEDNYEHLEPLRLAPALALRKAESALKLIRAEGSMHKWIFAADTLISFGAREIGKAHSRSEAKNILQSFSGCEHTVITGMALYSAQKNKMTTETVSSIVRFADLAESDIDWYLDTGEWQGAAGAYQIQGAGSVLIKEIHGSFSNIVGLPLYEFHSMLKTAGYRITDRTLSQDIKGNDT